MKSEIHVTGEKLDALRTLLRVAASDSMESPSSEDKNPGYVTETLPQEQIARIDTHLAECRDCAIAMDRLREGSMKAHLSEDEYLGYVTDTLSQEDVARVDTHLAECQDCAMEGKQLREGTDAWRGAEGEQRLARLRTRLGAGLFSGHTTSETARETHQDVRSHGALFSGDTTVETMRLEAFIEEIANPSHPHHGRIALPPIQRSPLWKPVQIIDLWDSLLRGMPFGSFLLARMQTGDPCRTFEGVVPEQAGITSTSPHKAGFFLADGLQRMHAVLLGYRPHPRARLWLDLGQAGKNGHLFSIHLTTDSQPFGLDPNDPARKLSAAHKRAARDAFFAENPQSRGQYDHELPLQSTRPWRATLPVPLVDLWHAWREEGRESRNDKWWHDVVRRCTHPGQASIQLTEAKPEIVAQLRPAFQLLDAFMLPLILIPNAVMGTHAQEEDGTHVDALETLYTRIGAGGTPLSGDEHVFSLMKHRWPQAHDLVYDLYGDPQIGQIVKPTEIVMTALRLVRADRGEVDVPRPRVVECYRWLTESVRQTAHAVAINQSGYQSEGHASPRTPLFETLQRFVASARLHTAFAQFRSLIDYRPAQPLDPGLPKAFVPYINLPALQVILRWIDLHSESEAAFWQANREDVLRFILFWHIAVEKTDDASKVMLAQIRAGESFPGRTLYAMLTTRDGRGQRFAPCVPSPQMLREALGEETGRLRTWAERFDPAQRQGDEQAAVLFLQRWWSKKDMLLWLQRPWVDTWFAGYDPLAGRDEDTPWDYDHILARDHLLYCAPTGQFPDAVAQERFSQRFTRELLCNALGNMRVWPSALNRGDGTELPATKLALASSTSRSIHWPANLQTQGDILAASAINPEDLALWREASGDVSDPRGQKRWSYDRIKAWQTVVENRVAWLYERFYRELNFAAWV